MRRKTCKPGTLDGSVNHSRFKIGHILAFKFLRALAPLSGHLDPGGFIKSERYGLLLPIGQG
jgi:hypothetical protein